ncbi:hypothetical protein EJB05_39505, partial [Eragrostis curvula]
MASAANGGTLTNPATSNDLGRCSAPRGIIMAGVAVVVVTGVAELPSMAAGGGSGPSDMAAAAAWDGGPPAYIASMAAAADGAPPIDPAAMAAAGNGVPPTGCTDLDVGNLRMHVAKHVLLRAMKTFRMKPPRCVLWNPAIADEKEVAIPYKMKSCDYDEIAVLGLGYGPISKTYKLLLSLRVKLNMMKLSNPPQCTYEKKLFVYTLGMVREKPRFVAELSWGVDRKISRQSLYVDGTVYLLFDMVQIIAFNIDNERFTMIDMPGSESYPVRPCLVKNDNGHRALWVLTEDHQWERRCVFKVEDDLIYRPIKGVWDHNGVLMMYLYNEDSRNDKLFLYQAATEKMENLPRELTPEGSDYSFCWGYMPTLVSVKSIVVKLGQDVERQRNHTVDMMKDPKAVNDPDGRNEQKTKSSTATVYNNTMGKRARSREIEEQETAAPSAPGAKKTKSNDDDAPGAGICDDVIENIFARLPVRSAVASMVLSKKHQRLICSPDFRSLHFRLGEPLPTPHIAYVVTAPKRRYKHEPVDGQFHRFNVAGAGLSKSAPMRMAADERYPKMKYVNTCHGILLFAGETNLPTCVLWNPAIAEKEEVIFPYTMTNSDYDILGLGYGPRSKTYKLLLSLRMKLSMVLLSCPPKSTYRKNLLVHTLGMAGEKLRSVSCLSSSGMDREISRQSLYIDGTVYLLYDMLEILAFNIDSETLTKIDMPGSERYPGGNLVTSKLMQISDRPCLVKNDNGHRALWVLTVEHQWEQRCVFKVEDDLTYCPIKSIWDHNGVLMMYLYNKDSRNDKLFLYQAATGKTLIENLPRELAPEGSDYSFCWGYRPTLVTKAVNEPDRRNEQKTNMSTVCFMEYMIRLMEKLPKNMQDVMNMSLFDSKYSGSHSQDAVWLDSD